MADEKDEKLKAQYLERIKSRTLSLSDLADELFKYSTSTDPERYPVQTENIVSEPIDICRVLEECILSFYAGFKKRGIEPDIEIPDEPVFVLCEKKSANRIFENIIGNAIKYANNDLKVKLDPKGQVIFSNPAPDLTPVSAAKLFDRYFTVNEGHASTGLGFSIAKELITRNNGTIEADLKDGILMITVSFNLKEAEEQN
jgi:signal transduction histidine kinase